MPKKKLTGDLFKKPTIDADKRRAFIEDGEAPAKDEGGGGQGSGILLARARKKRSDAATVKKEQLLVRLPPDLIKDIKRHVVDMPKGSTVSSFAEDAFRAALSGS